jgi:hypothetical protein
VHSLQDHISFIINIYQQHKFIQCVLSIPLKKSKYIRIVEILLILIWEDRWATITSKAQMLLFKHRKQNVFTAVSFFQVERFIDSLFDHIP